MRLDERERGRGDARELRAGHGVISAPERRSGSGTHLNEDQDLALQRDDVDLTETGSEIAFDNGATTASQQVHNVLLGLFTAPGATLRRGQGTLPPDGSCGDAG